MDSRTRRLVAARVIGVDLATVEVMTRLAEAGIETILLRGPVIAEWLYGPDEVRGYEDCDVLVPPALVPQAVQVLTSIGFAPFDPTGERGRRPLHAKTWLRPQDSAMVDLHRYIAGVRADPSAAWEILKRETEDFELRGSIVRAPTLPVRALIIALHVIHHGEAGIQPREDLRRVLALEPPVDWELTASIARRLDAAEALGAGLRVLDEGRPVADRLDLPPLTDTELLLRKGGAPSLAVTLEWFARSRGLRAKATIVRDVIFLPRDSLDPLLINRYGVARSYAVHWWRLVTRVPAALWAWSRARRGSRSA